MSVDEPVINVGILTSPKIEFVLNGDYALHDKNFISGKYFVIMEQGKLFFENSFYEELVFTPATTFCNFELKDVVIGINFHWERKEDQRFLGSLKFIVDADNILAINKVSTEDYLTSVISSEMSATASIELLKAHAVISRSWLLKPLLSDNQQYVGCKKEDNSNANDVIVWYERDCHSQFDVCADDHCQRYQGITKSSTEKVMTAISATRGDVLKFDGEICDARFSKSCGGVSENFENCWSPIRFPYLTSIFDFKKNVHEFKTNLTNERNADEWIRMSPPSFCNTTDKDILGQVLNNYDQETTDFYRWKVEYSQSELSEIISRRSGIDFGQIVDLIHIQRGESSRLIKLKIVGTKRTVTVGKELEIRKWLSNSHLYSSAFVIEKHDLVDGNPGKFVLIGAGWGHGVGLCQIGAAVMGEQGYDYQEILKHYFKGAYLERIY